MLFLCYTFKSINMDMKVISLKLIFINKQNMNVGIIRK